MTSTTAASFDRERHIRYFSHSLTSLPDPYSKLDTNRLTLVHFCVHALDLLGVLEERVNTHQIIEWIYSLQQEGGFIGGSFLPRDTGHSHIAMTYTALATLAALGDDLQRVHKQGIVDTLSRLQRPNGSFQSVVNMGSEHDMRFLYCACAISYMLNDWSGVNQDEAVRYIQSCVSFDGAIALLPGQEGHGGSTFCAVASLVLTNRLDAIGRKQLVQWCVSRQVAGMQGRPNKAEDTCYSYWIGGTLALLGHQDLLDQDRLCQYVVSCQTPMGGFGKMLGAYPDVLHSFYSMAWLSLSTARDEYELKPLNCTLGICQERASVFEGSVP